ncbi:MAG: GNAT family N-acetyltransferase [Oscillospiraceae bacterium]|nr:GNAT family N-acetyltransferase [Oscillospiraceae bacterium]
MNEITIRPARPEDVRPALGLAIRVYMISSAPLYEPEAVEYFPNKCRDEERVREFMDGKYLMFVAWDGEKLVGMAAQRGESVSHLYIDPAYHRRGIATKLMDTLIAAMGVPKVTLGSSPHGVPFYLKYGFVPTDAEQHKHGAIWTPMEYTVPVVIRQARPEEIAPALDFAQKIFEEYVLPDFDPPASERIGLHRDTEEQMRAYQEGRWAMLVALAGERIVGMACERDGSHIRKLYVDGAWHRRGIATKLLDAIIQSMDAPKITLNSSRYALRFYEKYGFKPTDTEQNIDGFVFTPMAYERAQPMHITIRPARPDDVRPALDLALRVFMEYQAPLYGSAQTENFRKLCIENEALTEAYVTQAYAMFVALDGARAVGMIGEERNEEIILVFVDPAYHRRGVATKLMDAMTDTMAKRGASRVALNSSPFGKPFYLRYGFRPTGEEQDHDGHIFTPMEYVLP